MNPDSYDTLVHIAATAAWFILVGGVAWWLRRNN
jgi:hypothetical protein